MIVKSNETQNRVSFSHLMVAEFALDAVTHDDKLNV